MPPDHFICSCCGKSKPIDQRILLGGDALCYACAEEFTTLCDRCGERVYRRDAMTGKSSYALSTMLWKSPCAKLIPLRVMLSVGFCILRRKLCLKIRNF